MRILDRRFAIDFAGHSLAGNGYGQGTGGCSFAGGVAGGVAEDAIDDEGGRAAAVHVHGVVGTQIFHDLGEFGEVDTDAVLLATVDDDDEEGFAFFVESVSGTRVAGGDEVVGDFFLFIADLDFAVAQDLGATTDRVVNVYFGREFDFEAPCLSWLKPLVLFGVSGKLQNVVVFRNPQATSGPRDLDDFHGDRLVRFDRAI